jgi:exosortase
MTEKRDLEPKSPASAASGAATSFAILLALIAWALWSSFQVMAARWAHDPQYSHGYIVPIFSIVLLWMRRETFPAGQIRMSLWGLLLLIVGLAVRLAAAMLYVEWFDFLSLIPCLMGVVLLCFGWSVARWAAGAIAFLVFMIPLPHTIETALRGPLRKLGTSLSTYVMQTFGMPVFAEGNVIVMDSHQIGVAEACSGLRMLVIFFALSTAVAMVSQRPWWERLIIVVSAVPIALIANISRITVTGILYQTTSAELAEKVFHDLAGWLMMPLGLVLLGIESWILSRLFIVEDDDPVMALTTMRPAMLTGKVGGAVTPAMPGRSSRHKSRGQ